MVISSVECLNSTPSQSHIISSGSISKSSPETKRVSNRQSDYKFSSSVLNILLLSLSLATYHSTSPFLSLPQPHPKLYRNIMCTGDPVCTEIAGSLLEGLQSWPYFYFSSSSAFNACSDEILPPKHNDNNNNNLIYLITVVKPETHSHSLFFSAAPFKLNK